MEEERLDTRGCEFVYVEMTCADSAGVPGRAAPLPPAPVPAPPRPLLPTLLDEREFLERSLPPKKEFSLREYDEVYGIDVWRGSALFFLCVFFKSWSVETLPLL